MQNAPFLAKKSKIFLRRGTALLQTPPKPHPLGACGPSILAPSALDLTPQTKVLNPPVRTVTSTAGRTDYSEMKLGLRNLANETVDI